MYSIESYSDNCSQVVYRKGSANLADTFSRLGAHVPDTHWTDECDVFIRRVLAESLSTLVKPLNQDDFDPEAEIFIRTIQEAAAVDIEEVIQATASDQEMQKLRACIVNDSWNNEDLKQYNPFRNEFTYVNSLILRGSKLVIPKSLRSRMLQLAHEGHPGQSLMKRRLRERCWWPGIDQSAVDTCESCEGCRLVQLPDPPEPMMRRQLPDRPWVDIAIDFLGPMPSAEYILVVIDYYSRYMELEVMSKITAQETIRRLRRIFRIWGPPRTITLDNAKQFVSCEFEEFCKANGIHLNHTSPYWPQANGEVERQNRSLLKRMKIANALYDDWKAELNSYLELYNNTPHTVTGKAPSELLQNRKLRTKLPCIDDLQTMPPSSDFRDQDHERKIMGKRWEDVKRRAKPSTISIGDTVLMKNLCPTNKLSTNFHKKKFLVVNRQGSNVTVQSMETGKTYDRNTSHLKTVSDPVPITVNDPDTNLDDRSLPTTCVDPNIDEESHDGAVVSHSVPEPCESLLPSVQLRRSARTPKPKEIYSP